MLSESEIIIDKLRQFLNKNAKFEIIKRSFNYYPSLISNKENTFLFECSGSEIEPYDVFIDLKNYYSIKTSCSCPYNGPGICKHEVASLSHLIDLIEDEAVDMAHIIVKTPFISPTTTIPHENGIIDVDELNRMEFASRTNYYSPLTITSVNKNRIDGVYQDFRNDYQLSLTFNRSNELMALKCSCKLGTPCSHKMVFLKEFFKKFGKDYFTENFLERFKQRTMEASRFDGLLEFEEIFDIEISTNGVKVTEKIKNIVGSDDTFFELFKEDRKAFFLPSSTEENASFGVGIGLEKSRNELSDVFAFTGKLDKFKTKLSTKFREISEYTITESLSLVEDKKFQGIIIKGVQLASVFSDSSNNDFSLDQVKKMISHFSSIIESYPEQVLYLRKSRKSFVKKHTTELTISHDKITPILKIMNKKPFYQLDFKVKIDNQTYGIASNKILITPFGIVLGEVFYVISNPEVAYSLMRAFHKPQMNVLQKGIDHLREFIIEPFSNVFDIDFAGMKSAKIEEESEIEKHVYLSDEDGEYVVLQPLIQYDKTLVSPSSKEKVWGNKGALTYQSRDEDFESEFLSEFKELHPKFEHQSNYFYLTVDEALDAMWLMEVIDKLKANNVRVFGLNDLKSIRYNLNKPSFSIGLSSGTDWFDMEIKVGFGGQTADLKQIQKSILKQTNYVELKDGSIGILPKEWIEKYKKYFKLGNVKKDKIEISNFQFNIIDELYEEETNAPKFLEELYQKKKSLHNLKDLKSIPKPKGIKATLRDYQHEGLNWLVFLHENKLGGCLADDMGLGKTLQTIAFLQYLKNENSNGTSLPHLVIAPTSLMFNWLAELEKFAPKLKVLSFIGPNRADLIKKIPKHDVVLTTYGSIIKDIETHIEIEYNYVILDESQAIKNPQSQRFKAVRLLKSKNRLALTGTPIENNTFDLYSQFSFLNPGIFGSIKHFKSTFSEAIDKDQDEYTSDLLARMIHPFLLRRTKTQVAKELPSKTEVVIYCEMGKAQRKVYDHYKEYFKQKLQQQIEEEGINKSQMYILQGLTKLRQICNSTALADKNKDYGNESAKLDELVRHLTEKVNNHKILVFSQFVGMLHLVKARLEQEGILFEYLDGKTRNREEKVNNFQNNDEIRVFLISLKAGGTGLNLTEADYVYLIDPWWNPAVESQAIDRCYRIGQDKKVMAYRMICRDTIEEKIVQLQDKKKTVAADIIRVDTEKKSFDKNDVELLFGMS
ncbi:DEAD/DEAH box helicase [Brumimicrobium mesophilum]|uniref:DEAD/DEAH box helicase n=1 Tax=Brumimicrobium mesophilum TaxID=392717 RepID=UPI000D144B34|nr:DEAD/DEAH box helicase [Brumimicrobium mesophilum]